MRPTFWSPIWKRARKAARGELVEELVAAKKADGASERYLQTSNGADRFRTVRRANGRDDHKRRRSTIGCGSLQSANLTQQLPARARRDVQPRVAVRIRDRVIQRRTPRRRRDRQAARHSDGQKPLAFSNRLRRSCYRMWPSAAFAGLRRAELERLDWLDVHFDADLIEVTAAKARRHGDDS